MNRHPGLAGTQDAPFSAGGRHAAADGDGDRHRKDLHDDDVTPALLLASVARDARLDQKYLLLITLSAVIATLGLLQNSPAVVIGAMLVSPLLGPIMGIGFGVATLDSGLIKRSLLTLAAGMAMAILVAMVLVWLSPVQDVTGELRARTQPNLLDLGVAVVGGVAGVYAILRRLSGVMVGVAIATALVPPLSTIGFGLATGRPDFAMGAALLFLTNTLAITFAATAVARMNRFGPSLTPKHTAMQVVGILAVLGLLSVPLAVSLNKIAREVAARSAVQAVIDELLQAQDRIDTLAVRMDGEKVAIEGVVLVDAYRPALSTQVAAQTQARLKRPVAAEFVQVRQQSDTALKLEDRVNQRLAALERRDAESAAVLAALTTGGLIGRETITLDAQTRRAVITRDRQAEGEQVAAAKDRIIDSARQIHVDWFITGLAARPEADATE
jgi:uncharacterized hydrophobic protein (TIGR00271 family)